MTASTGSAQGLRRKDRLFAADAARPTLEPPVLFRLPAFGVPDAAPAAAESAERADCVVQPTASQAPEPEPIAVPATAALEQHLGNVATAPLPASGMPIAPRTQTDSRFLTADTRQPEPVRESWAPLAPLGQVAKTSPTPFRGAAGDSQRKPWMEVAGSRLVLLLLLAVVAVAALIAARGTDISNPIRLAGQQTTDQHTSTGSPYASSGSSSAASQRPDDTAGPRQLANTDQAPAAPGGADSTAAASRPAESNYATRRPGNAAADSQVGSQAKTETATDDPQVLEFAPPATVASSASSGRGASQPSPTPADSERLADASAVGHQAAASSAGASGSEFPDDAAMMLGPADRGTAVDNTAAQQTTPAASAPARSPGAHSVNPYADLPTGDLNDALAMALESADAPDTELPPAGAATPTSDDSVGPPPIQMTETPRGVYDWNRYLPPPAGGSVSPAQDLAAQPSGDRYLAAAPGGFAYPTPNPGDAAAVYPGAPASAPGGGGGFGSPAPQPPNGFAPYGGYGAPLPQAGHPDAGYLPTNGPNASYPNAGYPNTGNPNTAGGYPQADYPQADYPQADYPSAGYPQAGYPPAGYPPAGFPPAGYPPAGFPGAGYAPAAGAQPSVPPQEAPLQASSPYDAFPRR